MNKLTPFHLDIIDVHDGDIVCALPFCMFLFGSPNPNRICACRSVYVIKRCRTDHCSGMRPAVAFRHSIDCVIPEADAVPARKSLPKSTSFFQFESFMWSLMTSL